MLLKTPFKSFSWAGKTKQNKT